MKIMITNPKKCYYAYRYLKNITINYNDRRIIDAATDFINLYVTNNIKTLPHRLYKTGFFYKKELNKTTKDISYVDEISNHFMKDIMIVSRMNFSKDTMMQIKENFYGNYLSLFMEKQQGINLKVLRMLV